MVAPRDTFTGVGVGRKTGSEAGEAVRWGHFFSGPACWFRSLVRGSPAHNRDTRSKTLRETRTLFYELATASAAPRPSGCVLHVYVFCR